jgi:hypothetical protein
MAWTTRTKPTTTFTGRDAGIENYILNQDTDFLLHQDGSLVIFSNLSQWLYDRALSYLLQENTLYLLNEDGTKIALDDTANWTDRTAVSASSWTVRN